MEKSTVLDFESSSHASEKVDKIREHQFIKAANCCATFQSDFETIRLSLELILIKFTEKRGTLFKCKTTSTHI